ncbi:hypothetical protein [Rhodopila sp.]|uniref:hypothetical protein n=1 Tax=Rhodopila sp. TaxID=2480087 RepID=UPI003D0DF22E
MARVLIDQSAPRRIAQFLTAHHVEVAYDRGWATLTNGDLLDAIEQAGFEVFVTADQNLRFQQNLRHRRVAIVVIGTNTWPVIAGNSAPVVRAVADAKPGAVSFVPYPKPPRPKGPQP